MESYNAGLIQTTASVNDGTVVGNPKMETPQQMSFAQHESALASNNSVTNYDHAGRYSKRISGKMPAGKLTYS